MLERRKVVEGLEEIVGIKRMDKELDYYLIVCSDALKWLRKDIADKPEERKVDTLKVCKDISGEIDDEIYGELAKQYLAKAMAEKLMEDGYITICKHEEGYPRRIVYEARLDVARPPECVVKFV